MRLPTVAPAAFWALLFLNSFLAYFVNLTNFLVTKHTSALTLQVRGGGFGRRSSVLGAPALLANQRCCNAADCSPLPRN